jgi:hypothetical protein
MMNFDDQAKVVKDMLLGLNSYPGTILAVQSVQLYRRLLDRPMTLRDPNYHHVLIFCDQDSLELSKGRLVY